MSNPNPVNISSSPKPASSVGQDSSNRSRGRSQSDPGYVSLFDSARRMTVSSYDFIPVKPSDIAEVRSKFKQLQDLFNQEPLDLEKFIQYSNSLINTINTVLQVGQSSDANIKVQTSIDNLKALKNAISPFIDSICSELGNNANTTIYSADLKHIKAIIINMLKKIPNQLNRQTYSPRNYFNKQNNHLPDNELTKVPPRSVSDGMTRSWKITTSSKKSSIGVAENMLGGSNPASSSFLPVINKIKNSGNRNSADTQTTNSETPAIGSSPASNSFLPVINNSRNKNPGQNSNSPVRENTRYTNDFSDLLKNPVSMENPLRPARSMSDSFKNPVSMENLFEGRARSMSDSFKNPVSMENRPRPARSISDPAESNESTESNKFTPSLYLGLLKSHLQRRTSTENKQFSQQTLSGSDKHPTIASSITRSSYQDAPRDNSGGESKAPKLSLHALTNQKNQKNKNNDS